MEFTKINAARSVWIGVVEVAKVVADIIVNTAAITGVEIQLVASIVAKIHIRCPSARIKSSIMAIVNTPLDCDRVLGLGCTAPQVIRGTTNVA